MQLKDRAGTVLETVTRRIGIREVSIQDGVFCVNHVPVKLTGICRHDVSPTLGTAVNEELWRKDITLCKGCNINAIRTSHYPYGPGFYDLCDELGIYVMDEVPYCWSPNDDLSLTPAYEQRARETVRRDKNHPCVLLWAIGNEGKGGTELPSRRRPGEAARYDPPPHCDVLPLRQVPHRDVRLSLHLSVGHC